MDEDALWRGGIIGQNQHLVGAAIQEPLSLMRNVRL